MIDVHQWLRGGGAMMLEGVLLVPVVLYYYHLFSSTVLHLLQTSHSIFVAISVKHG